MPTDAMLDMLLQYAHPMVVIGLIGFLVFSVLIDKLQLPQSFRWTLDRHLDKHKSQLVFVSEQLKNENLSPEVRHHLECQRDSLLLKVTQGIEANAHLARALMAISEDRPGGIEWRQIRWARPLLKLDSSGELTVVSSRFAWVIVALLCLPPLMSGLIALGYLGMAFMSGDTKTAQLNFLVALVYGVILRASIGPWHGTLAARHIDRQLRDRKATPTIASVPVPHAAIGNGTPALPDTAENHQGLDGGGESRAVSSRRTQQSPRRCVDVGTDLNQGN